MSWKNSNSNTNASLDFPNLSKFVKECRDFEDLRVISIFMIEHLNKSEHDIKTLEHDKDVQEARMKNKHDALIEEGLNKDSIFLTWIDVLEEMLADPLNKILPRVSLELQRLQEEDQLLKQNTPAEKCSEKSTMTEVLGSVDHLITQDLPNPINKDSNHDNTPKYKETLGLQKWDLGEDNQASPQIPVPGTVHVEIEPHYSYIPRSSSNSSVENLSEVYLSTCDVTSLPRVDLGSREQALPQISSTNQPIWRAVLHL
ncbi:hypothetical protein BDQ17DRAFT_1545112 [Cyathus striatus]|nr:hypothetical protein BDQ17DRAFT_1545112 [Cyathus striatus]